MRRIHQIQPNMFKRMNRKGRYGLLVLSIILFTGCMVGKKYNKPDCARRYCVSECNKDRYFNAGQPGLKYIMIPPYKP